MSKRMHLTNFSRWEQNNIKHVLILNGWSYEDVESMWDSLTVADVDDIVDFDRMGA